MKHFRIIWQIAVKNLKTFVREIKSNAIVFILPIVFITVFKFAFGGTSSDVTFDVGILKESSEIGEVYEEELANLENQSEESLVEVVNYENREEMRRAVEEDDLDGAVVVREEGVVLIGDTLDPNFQAVSGVVTQLTNAIYQVESVVDVKSLVQQDDDFSGFTYLVPGLIVYGMIMLIPQVAIVLSQEREKHHTFRYFTSQVNGIHMILGYLISHGLIGLIQSALLFGAVLLYGYESQASIIPALVVAVPTTFFCVGLGLVIGGLVTNSEESGNWGTIVTIILGFLSGAFISVPEVAIVGELTLSDILPTAVAAEALRQTMQFGQGYEVIWWAVIEISVVAVVLIVLGGYLYTKRQLTRIDL